MTHSELKALTLDQLKEQAAAWARALYLATGPGALRRGDHSHAVLQLQQIGYFINVREQDAQRAAEASHAVAV